MLILAECITKENDEFGLCESDESMAAKPCTTEAGAGEQRREDKKCPLL